MSDVVDRLLHWPFKRRHKIVREAADTITTLRAEVERLRGVMKTAIRQFEDGNLLECHRTLCNETYGEQL